MNLTIPTDFGMMIPTCTGLPKFSKGAVVSPCSDSVDAQLAKMERKVAAGADYFQTQAVFEPEKFIKFMEKAKQFGKPRSTPDSRSFTV